MNSTLYAAEIKALARRRFSSDCLTDPDHTITVDNPLCGDCISMDLHIQDQHIHALAHRVRGCILCQASAAIIHTAIAGTPVSELQFIHNCMLAVLNSESSCTPPSGWEKLHLFTPVANYKSRHECVLLPFRALLTASN